MRFGLSWNMFSKARSHRSRSDQRRGNKGLGTVSATPSLRAMPPTRAHNWLRTWRSPSRYHASDSVSSSTFCSLHLPLGAFFIRIVVYCIHTILMGHSIRMFVVVSHITCLNSFWIDDLIAMRTYDQDQPTQSIQTGVHQEQTFLHRTVPRGIRVAFVHI